MRTAATSLITLGIILAIGALVYQPTVESAGIYGGSSETYNIGKMQYQLMFFQAGLASFLAGCFLVGCSEIRAGERKVSKAQPVDPAPPLSKVPAPDPGPEPLDADREGLLAHYGITRDGSLYVYGKYRYALFDDAVRDARRLSKSSL